MASIFMSFSSRDERAAVGLQNWLREHHHEAVLHPRTKQQEQGAFDELKHGLEDDIGKADIVLFLVTPFWSASKLCRWEMETAKATAKPLVAILEAPSLSDFASQVFVVDMTKNRENGLASLRDELKRLASGEPASGGTGSEEIKGSPDVVLQGAVFADHDPKTKAAGDNAKIPVSPAARRQSGVNRTLKILRRGIRWSAFPAWFTGLLKLPVAGTRVKTQKTLASLYKKYAARIPKLNPSLKSGTRWVLADKMRMVGAAFLAFVVATAFIGLVSDRSIGGKEAMRKELANVKKRQSLFLSRVATHLHETGDAETALLLGLEALEEAQQQEDRQKARDVLYTAWIKIQDRLVFRGHDNHVSGVMFSPDGLSILSSSWDRTARVWKISSRKQVLVLDKHDGFVNGAVYSPDQSLILTAALDNKARLFNARTGKLIRILKGHSHDLTSAAFSFDGRRIVTASGDQTARIWEVAGGKTLKTFLGHKAGLEHAGFSPDGNRIVTASADKVARILDVDTGDQLAILEGHGDVVRDARFNTAGDLIATASEDKTVRLWEARSGVLVRILKGHKFAVLTVAFSPDGKRLVTASKDNTARIWDVETGDMLLVLRGHKGIVSQASFSPRGQTIVTASGDGTIRLWPLANSDKDLVNRARRTVSKCLSLQQRKKYFLSEKPPEWCIRLKKPPFRK